MVLRLFLLVGFLEEVLVVGLLLVGFLEEVLVVGLLLFRLLEEVLGLALGPVEVLVLVVEEAGRP